MNIAVLSESSADEAAVRILAKGLLPREVNFIDLNIRSRGWASVRKILPSVIKHLHYHTDADGLIVVADSNHTAISDPRIEDETTEKKCRLQKLKKLAETTLQHLQPVATRKERIKVAIGLAAPCIEAWYLCGQNPNVSEMAWQEYLKIKSRKEPYKTLSLKREVYGTDRPSILLETEHAQKQAERLAMDTNLLEQKFPIGFGSLAISLRSW